MFDKLEKYILFVLAVILSFSLFFSCKIKEKAAVNRVDSVYIQKLIPITLPADSAALKALLKCTATGKIVMNQLNIETSKNAKLEYMLDSLGNLEVKTIVKHDTIYLKADSIRISDVITKYEYIEKPLTKWENFIQKFGTGSFYISIALFGVLIIYIILKLKAKF